ncbi:MAG: nitroreductase family protein [Candidatus Hadarchaeales archaeon]
MDLSQAIRGRRSVREYKPDDVPESDLRAILEAGIHAPSAGNCQPWEFVVVRDASRKQALSEAAHGQRFIVEAPVVIVVCANIPRTSARYGRRGAELYCIQDTAAAVQNMLLMAYSMGYGTCWVGAFDEGKAARAVCAPDGVRPVAMILLGKPAERPRMPGRISFDEVVHIEKF